MTEVVGRLQHAYVRKERGRGVCVFSFLVDRAFISMTRKHAACYHRRCPCGRIHMACLGARGDFEWQTLIIFNPRGILSKWKAAFQFYNPAVLISPSALIHTVQLDEQDWPDESCLPLTASVSCWSPALTFTECCRAMQCAKSCPVNPPVSTAVLALLTRHWLDLDLIFVSVCGSGCESGLIQPLWHRDLTCPRWVQRESAHYGKRSRTSESAEFHTFTEVSVSQGRCKGSSGGAFRLMARHMAKKAGDWQKGRESECQNKR